MAPHSLCEALARAGSVRPARQADHSPQAGNYGSRAAIVLALPFTPPFGTVGLSAYVEFLNFRNASLAFSKSARA
jgi:hypothetical protein